MSTNAINGQQVDVYIRDVNNYKVAKRKKTPFYCCMPPIGTLMLNQFTKERVATTKEQRFVISDYKGEQKVIDMGTFLSNFKFEDGNEITTKWLEKRIENDSIPWFKCAYYPPNLEYYACFVPEHIPFCITVGDGNLGGKLFGNAPNRKHGKGDFIVCPAQNSKPALQFAKIVNGLDFSAMYNLRGWKDCVVSVATDTIQRPAPIKNTEQDDVELNTSNVSSQLSSQEAVEAYKDVLEKFCPKKFWDAKLIKAIRNKDAKFTAYAEVSMRAWDKLSKVANTSVQALFTVWERGMMRTFENVADLLQPTYLRNVAMVFRQFVNWKSGKTPWKVVCDWIVDDDICFISMDFSLDLPYGVPHTPANAFRFAFNLYPSVEGWKYGLIQGWKSGGEDFKEGQFGISGHSELYEGSMPYRWGSEEYREMNLVPTLHDTARMFKNCTGAEALKKIERPAKKYAGELVTCILQEFRLAAERDKSSAALLHLPTTALQVLANKEYYFVVDDTRQAFSPYIYFVAYLQACLKGETMGTWNARNGTLGFVWDKGWLAFLAKTVRGKSAMEFSVEYCRTTDAEPTHVLIGDVQIDPVHTTEESYYFRLIPEQVNYFLEAMYKAIGQSLQVLRN